MLCDQVDELCAKNCSTVTDVQIAIVTDVQIGVVTDVQM